MKELCSTQLHLETCTGMTRLQPHVFISEHFNHFTNDLPVNELTEKISHLWLLPSALDLKLWRIGLNRNPRLDIHCYHTWRLREVMTFVSGSLFAGICPCWEPVCRSLGLVSSPAWRVGRSLQCLPSSNSLFHLLHLPEVSCGGPMGTECHEILASLSLASALL